MRIVQRVMVRCVFSVILLTLYTTTLSSQEQPRSTPKADELTAAQFDALRDDQLIEVGGKRMTKREILAEAARRRAEGQAKAEAAERQASAVLQEENEKLERSEQARIEKENAELKVEQASAPQEDASLPKGNAQFRAEAVQLRARATRATSEAELLEIHQRARQLIDQLRRL